MFNSSLRSRPEWASVVPLLTRSSVGWRETTLDGCDIAFQVANDSPGRLFRVILLCSAELGDAATADKIERLKHLDGGSQVGIILLLEHGVAAFAKFQADLLANGRPIPIIPIMNAGELPARLADWRRQLCDKGRTKPSEIPKTLVSHCVHGPTMSERQTNIMMDICSGFRELAHNVHDPKKLNQMADYLGQRDTERLAEFLRGGTQPVDM